MLHILDFIRGFTSEAATAFPSHTTAVVPHLVITDLTVCISPPSTCELVPRVWHRVEKDLHLYTSMQSA